MVKVNYEIQLKCCDDTACDFMQVISCRNHKYKAIFHFGNLNTDAHSDVKGVLFEYFIYPGREEIYQTLHSVTLRVPSKKTWSE